MGAMWGIGQNPQEGVWEVFFCIGNALHGSSGILVTMHEQRPRLDASQFCVTYRYIVIWNLFQNRLYLLLAGLLFAHPRQVVNILVRKVIYKFREFFCMPSAAGAD